MNERRNGSCRCGERAQYAHYAPYGPRTMPHSHSHKDACTAAEKKSYTHYSHAEKVEQARSCGCEKKVDHVHSCGCAEKVERASTCGCAEKIKRESSCGCEEKTEYVSSCGCTEKAVRESAAFTPVMAYVPFQEWEEPFCEMEALCVGTLFPSLEKPFLGKRGCCND